MPKNVLLWTAIPFFLCSLAAFGTAPPASIGQGTNSFAMQLHYPPKEKAAKKEGVLKFYCEISTQGKPGHILTLYGKGQERFGTAVEFALHHGSFNPATVDNKPVAVLLGGTVLFLMNSGQPTIAVSLTTAESDKIAKMANCQQPQLLDSDALFRRKIFAHRDKYTLRYGAHPGAIVRAQVDVQGKLVSKSIESESPPNAGHGRLLLDVLEEEHFIPALALATPESPFLGAADLHPATQTSWAKILGDSFLDRLPGHRPCLPRHRIGWCSR